MQDMVMENSREPRTAVLNGIVREGLAGKVTFEPRLEEMRG